MMSLALSGTVSRYKVGRLDAIESRLKSLTADAPPTTKKKAVLPPISLLDFQIVKSA